jgi:PAT family beta-lactamase induction signal transducer AmpG
MIGLDEHRQALYVGVRSTFYRLAMIFGTGLLVMLAGVLESRTGPRPIEIPMAAAPKGVHIAAATTPHNGEFLKLEPRTARIEAGTTTALQATLAQQPKEKTIVSITRRNSSLLASFFPIGPEQLVTIKAGDRLEFTPENWNKPQTIVVGADAKLREETLAVYKATAGNIALTWSMCFAGMAGLFLLMAGLHSFVLPRPLTDGADAASAPKSPFLVAAGALVGTMLVPIAIIAALFYVLKYYAIPAGIALYHVLLQKSGAFSAEFAAAVKSDNDVRTFITDLLIVLIIWLIYRSGAIRRASMQGFRTAARASGVAFDDVFISFFSKAGICRMIAFLLLYRLGEALLLKLAAPFLLDPRTKGGLGLTQAEYGLAYGTIGVLSLTFGGILGGVLAGSGGLRKWLVPMCLGLNLPHLLYVYMAYRQPESLGTVMLCVAGEQFGYGFGFAAYMVYMLFIAGQGEHKTSHFALCTGFMALSMMLPGMVSGAIYEIIGDYKHFFMLCVAAGLPGLLLLPFIPLDPEFGKKTKLAIGRH